MTTMVKKKPKISIRARRYIKNKVSGMSDYQSALKAGYAPATAIKASSKDGVENRSVKKLLTDLMDEKGLTDEHLLDKTQEGLNEANKIHGSDDNFVEVPDYGVRHKYLETALRLKGHGQQTAPAVAIQQNFMELTDEQLSRIIKE